jgi:hypothetical protein
MRLTRIVLAIAYLNLAFLAFEVLFNVIHTVITP